MASTPKIFGIGLSKSGTTSLYAALDMLGLKAGTFRHMRDLGLEKWISGDFSKDYLEDFEAVTDLPLATWFRELDERYPGSKFILTTRPVEPWLASIRKQFEANPDPKPGFNRDVRLAQYGVTTFNEARFRRLHGEHAEAVKAHFADRPDDLLEMDLFAGDGWKKLCSFLDKPVPDAAFPSVKPGFKLENARSVFNGNDGDFTCLIPVVHPDGGRIQSYGEVEALLKTTLSSILAINGPKPKIGIICHKVPDWAGQMPENVRFLNVGLNPLLPAERNHVQIDKGLKYILGILWAFHEGAPRFIMPCDGDDYLHRNMMQEVFSNEKDLADRDGFVVINGVHALLNWKANRLSLEAAFSICDFHLTCGTCRIFRAQKLLEAVRKITGNLERLPVNWKTDLAGRTTIVDEPSLDELMKTLEPLFNEDRGLVRLLGRHAQQHPEFSFLPLKESLVAKGCGHGNHDGPRGGDVHWHRIIGIMNNRSFARKFGLKGIIDLPHGRNWSLLLRGYAGLIRGKIKRMSDRSANSKRRHY